MRLSADISVIIAEDTSKIPVALLKLADPSLESINTYLPYAEALIAINKYKIIACCLVLDTGVSQAEIKNIAVLEEYQGKGIGQYLLKASIALSRKKGLTSLFIGTGNSSIKQLYLYQKMGFRLSHIIRDHFIKNYKEEIWENGIRCTDMVMLEKVLT